MAVTIDTSQTKVGRRKVAAQRIRDNVRNPPNENSVAALRARIETLEAIVASLIEVKNGK